MLQGMSNSTPNFKAALLAAPHSGSGKTIICRGLTAALCNAGFKVQTFKTGPDYIDPAHLAAASKRPCHNLDIWLMGEAGCRDLWLRETGLTPYKPRPNTPGPVFGLPDLALIEGVMGLYDGVGSSAEASSAHLARLLNVPVILIVDVKGMGNSFSALVKGFMEFEGAPAFAGIILNRVGSSAHAALLQASLQSALGKNAPPVLGALPVDPALAVPERHMGLLTPEELNSKSVQSGENADQALQTALTRWIGSHIDLKALVQALPSPQSLTETPCMEPEASTSPRPYLLPPEHNPPQPLSPQATLPRAALTFAPKSRLCLAVARDRAFCFYYEENLSLLREAGFELRFFSPLHDTSLPANSAGLYLGGGYPELFAATLSRNTSLLNSIRDFCAAGKPVYGEGGGYVYLCQSLTVPAPNPGEAAQTYPLLGCLPGRCEFAAKRQALGYRQATCLVNSPLGQANTLLRGHELRYCFLQDAPPAPNTNQGNALFQLEDRQGHLSLAGSAHGNICASFLHLHFASNPAIVKNFYQACLRADPK